MDPRRDDGSAFSRREVLRAGAIGGAALAMPSGVALARVRRRKPRPPAGPASIAATYGFNQGWRFGGRYVAGAEQPGFRDRAFNHVTVPHTVVPLSWGDWDPGSWQQLWIYRKHFAGAALLGGRVLLDFDGVMMNAKVFLNGAELAHHIGGYLPFSVELTEHLVAGDNLLAVVVDSRWLDVPPQGNANGPGAVDYFQPGGIYRDVTLRVVPESYIADVFAKPINVLTRPGLELEVTIDAATRPAGRTDLLVELLAGARVVASKTVRVTLPPGRSVRRLSLGGLRDVNLWSPSTPSLYTVRVTLSGHAIPPHTVKVTTGFREARFEVTGFYLNGQRMEIFGLNRHQLFPYTGMAAPARLQARDAELLRRELNCNMVRCSHYPQSPHFLDACDRLGLLVWQEVPGWQYVGDPDFDAIFLQNVHDMIVRDRNRPSVIVWGTRLNESASYPTLYAEARALAGTLDATRQTTGAMPTHSTVGWAEDVFAYDDYHAASGRATLSPPVPGVPYLVSEAVGALDGAPLYRWIDSSSTLQLQAELHAQVHDIAQSDPAYAGLIAWAGIDYASVVGGNRVWHNLRWPGVLDTFRVPKPGASCYRSQVSPAVVPLIVPAFYWDFGPASPPTGPGQGAMLATNCEALQIYVGGQPLTTVTPDTLNYGSLAFPPAFVNLTVDGSALPELLVVGLVGGKPVTTLRMSADPTRDRLVGALEDATIAGDGSDATRFTFRALDAYGNQRPYVSGDVALTLTGPAQLVGQNPFAFAEYGGVGGVLIRSLPDRSGAVRVTASHPTLGSTTARLTVTRATGRQL